MSGKIWKNGGHQEEETARAMDAGSYKLGAEGYHWSFGQDVLERDRA